jgi:hypothetical protein
MEVDITGGAWRIRMSHTLPLSSACMNGLYRLAEQLHQRISLFQRFRFERSPANPNLYDYRIWLTDTRLWKQTFLFAGPRDDNPTQTFDVAPGWKPSEFTPHREWRELMVDLRNSADASLVRVDPV